MNNSNEIKKFIINNSNKIFQDAADISIPEDIKNRIKNNRIPYKFTSKGKDYLLIKLKTGNIRQLLPLSETFHQSDDFYSIYGRSVIRGDWWPQFNLDMMNISKEDDTEFKNGKKPLRLIKQLLKWSGIKNGIVLDFFAGSGTTASAVINSNVEQNNHNNFIMVQLPENLNKNSNKSIGTSYASIDEISRERIKRAAKKIKEENSNLPQNFDGGFKHYRVVSSQKATLDKILEFDPNEYELVSDMVDSFSSEKLGIPGNASGEDTILTTWLAQDGYDFDFNKLALYDFNGYKAYGIKDNRLYLINDNWNSDCTKALLNQLGNGKIKFQSIVIYGYSFNIIDLKELELGILQLNSKVNLIKRY